MLVRFGQTGAVKSQWSPAPFKYQWSEPVVLRSHTSQNMNTNMQEDNTCVQPRDPLLEVSTEEVSSEEVDTEKEIEARTVAKVKGDIQDTNMVFEKAVLASHPPSRTAAWERVDQTMQEAAPDGAESGKLKTQTLNPQPYPVRSIARAYLSLPPTMSTVHDQSMPFPGDGSVRSPVVPSHTTCLHAK